MKPQTFTSFEEYAAAIRHLDVRVTLLGASSGPWKAAHLQLNGLSMQWGEDGGPIAFEGAVDREGWMIFIPLRTPHMMIGNGIHFDAGSYMVLPPGAEFCTVALSPVPWAALYIPNASLPLETVGACKMLRASESEIARFVSLLGRIIAAVENNVFVRNPHLAIAAASAELLTSVRRLLGGPLTAGPRHWEGPHRVSRAAIVSAALQVLRGSDRLTVPIQDLADAADVSERTLRNAFYEYLGVSPHRYARLKALNAARRLLRHVDPQRTGVTEIATQLGFWEFGRFSRDYRVLFGELPSKTLHMRRDDQQSLAAHAR